MTDIININLKLHDVVKKHDNASDAFFDLVEHCAQSTKTKAYAYFIGVTIMKACFSIKSIKLAMYQSALFDQYDDDPKVHKRAKRIVTKFEQTKCLDKFICDLVDTGVAVLMTETIVYLAHKCQKRSSKPYQVSVFVKGFGVSGDSTYDSPEQILEPTIIGAGIPHDAIYLPSDEYERIESEFNVDSYW